jgi:hypothetical protein
MKIFVQSPDARGQIDGSVQSHLLAHLPDQVSSPHDSNVCVIPISFFADYKFNPKLNDIPAGKPIVIIDFTEAEWCFFNEKTETHRFGYNTRENRWFNANWYPFDDWARCRQPILYFKRELLAAHVADRILPVEWPCYLSDAPVQSEEEWNRRPLEVFFNWGYSNPVRPKLHGDIFHAMNNGIGVISEASQFDGFIQNHPAARAWMSVFTPWYSRVKITDLLTFQRQAKLSVSLPGAGVKCFRHAESPCESIMALQEDALAWSYPWEHGVNCVRLRNGHEFEDLDAATQRPDLYDIYRKSQETIAHYRGPTYAREYVLARIEAALS